MLIWEFVFKVLVVSKGSMPNCTWALLMFSVHPTLTKFAVCMFTAYRCCVKF